MVSTRHCILDLITWDFLAASAAIAKNAGRFKARNHQTAKVDASPLVMKTPRQIPVTFDAPLVSLGLMVRSRGLRFRQIP
jgi:hypothetical protein